MHSPRRARIRTITFWKKLWKVLNTPIHVLWESRRHGWTDQMESPEETTEPKLHQPERQPLEDETTSESAAATPSMPAETDPLSNPAEQGPALDSEAASEASTDSPALPETAISEPSVPEQASTEHTSSEPTSSGPPDLNREVPEGQAAPEPTASPWPSSSVPRDENTRMSGLPAAPLLDFSRVSAAEDLALEHLRAGVSTFNAWREQEHHAPLMLVNTDFSGIDLQGVDWRGCVLVHADFSTANLTNARFDEAVVKGCNFGRAVLDGAHFGTQDPMEITSAGLDVLLRHPEVASGSSWARFQVDFGVTLVGQPRKRAKKVRQGLKIENRTKDTLRFSVAVYENEWPLFATESLLHSFACDELVLIFSQPANMEDLTLQVQVFPPTNGSANTTPDMCIGTFATSPFTGSKKRSRTVNR
jgi:hypothetical protein